MLRNAFDGGRRTATFGPVPGPSGSRPKAREPLKVASHTLQRGFPGSGPSGVRMRFPGRSMGYSCAVRTVSLLVRNVAPRGGGAKGIVEQVIPWFH